MPSGNPEPKSVLLRDCLTWVTPRTRNLSPIHLVFPFHPKTRSFRRNCLGPKTFGRDLLGSAAAAKSFENVETAQRAFLGC
jgi:hypothetical protein